MRKLIRGVGPALLALLMSSAGANTMVIVDNGGPLAGGSSGASDLDAITTGGLYQEIADDFTLSAAANIGAINWWGAYTPNNQNGAVPDDFTIRVLDSAFNLVSSINVGTVASIDTGLDNLLGLDIYAYATAISPLSLTAGQYFLSIVNNTPGDGEGERWSWQSTGLGTGLPGGQFRQSLGVAFTDSSSGWNATNTDFAFSMTAIPAPGTLALLGLGLVGAGLARRKSRV